jgi:hypothetical protein
MREPSAPHRNKTLPPFPTGDFVTMLARSDVSLLSLRYAELASVSDIDLERLFEVIGICRVNLVSG